MGPKKAPSFQEQACLQAHSPPGWESQEMGSGDIEFGDVSYSLASGLECETTHPYPSLEIRLTHFHPFARHARVLRIALKTQACTAPKVIN